MRFQSDKHLESILTGIHTMRREGTVITNIYIPDLELQTILNQKETEFEVTESGLYIIQKNNGFSRLMFMVKSPDKLSEIKMILADSAQTIVTDIIGKEATIAKQTSILTTSGLNQYACYQRMAKIFRTPSEESDTTNRTSLALEPDASEIHEHIYQEFDPLSEHLPSLEDIHTAIKAGTIIVIRTHERLGGFIYYDLQGKTSLIRYTCVHKEYRKCGYDLALITRYFQDTKGILRSLLWVNEENPARYMYEFWGYQSDRLLDRIFIRKGAEHA